MSSILTTTSSTSRFDVKIESTHRCVRPAGLPQGCVDIDSERATQGVERREHIVSYDLKATTQPGSDAKDKEVDEEKGDVPLSTELGFLSCYHHISANTSPDGTYHTAVHIDEFNNVRLFDIMGEQTPCDEALSQIPAKEEDIRNQLKTKWHAQISSKNSDKKLDVIYQLPENQILVPLTNFSSLRDLIKSMMDCIVAHKALADAGEVHGNIDLNTVITTDPKKGPQEGFLFDYEPANDFAVVGFEEFNWKALMAGVPSMREMVPEFVEGAGIYSLLSSIL